MEVRVKEGKSGFIYGSLRTEGTQFTLKKVECINETDEKGKPKIITPEDQFSNTWMEKVKSPGRPKKQESLKDNES